MSSKAFKHQHELNNRSFRLGNCLLSTGVYVFCLIWMVAVVKVILLEGERNAIDTVSNKKSSKPVSSKSEIFKNAFTTYESHAVLPPLSVDADSRRIIVNKASDWSYVKDPKRVAQPEHDVDSNSIPVVLNSAPHIVLSKESKRAARKRVLNDIRRQDKIEQESVEKDKTDAIHTDKGMEKTTDESAPKDAPVNLKPQFDLQWPPVLPDGSIPADEGYDVMTITNLKVPKFWEPHPTEDVNKIGTKVNGEETIFFMVASYRDFQCHDTITSAFKYADHPERVFVGAVEQNVPGDLGCAYTEKSCEENPEQMICKYRDQISVYPMDASMATGPVTARHIGDRLYRGQYFVMQMDAHCQFVRHWDTMQIDQWRMAKNEMAVISTYLTDVQGSISPEGKSLRDTRPIMCNSNFEGAMPSRYLRHGSQPEDYTVIKDSPQLQPFWAAGFSFSRGHFKVRVPYDAYQPMVFQGEEISIGVRGFTYGYDFYAPLQSVVFHEYAEKSNRRKKVPMFWENSEKHKGEGRRSLSRSMSIIHMSPDIDPTTWDHREEDKYGIGKVRDVELFYKIFLVDTKARQATMLCPFVKSGIMHREFSKFLREDRLGIDYSKLENFDTKAILDRRMIELGRAVNSNTFPE